MLPHPLDDRPGGNPNAAVPCPRVCVEAEAAPVFLGSAAAYGRDGESGDIAGRIERDIEIGGTGVTITAQGGKVVLTGRARSWRERDLAERVAWSAPGVTQVEDRLIVQQPANA